VGGREGVEKSREKETECIAAHARGRYERVQRVARARGAEQSEALKGDEEYYGGEEEAEGGG